MSLQGASQLMARLTAIGGAFDDMGHRWATEDVARLRARIPVRTGKTRASLKVGRADRQRATVVGSAVANILDAGARAHDIDPVHRKILKFEVRGQTHFARKIHKPRQEGRHFKAQAGRQALAKVDMAGTLIGRWNGAA